MAKVKYRPQGEILCRFGLSTADVQVIKGPLGSGKTKATVFKILKLLAEQKANSAGIRQSRVAAIRNTYPDLNTTTIREFKECVSSVMGKLVNGHPPVYKFNFDLPDNTRVEAEVDFLALDRPEDVRKLRGTQYTFAWLNEGKELPKAVLDMVLGRIDRYPTPGFSTWVGVLSDTNAWDEDHWLEELHQSFLANELPGYEFFIQPGAVMKVEPDFPGAAVSQNGTYWAVNPAAENLVVLRKDYYQRQIAGKKDDWIKVNLANETGLAIDGKAVHPDYEESTHRAVKDLDPIVGTPVLVGLDFGLSPAAAFAQRQPNGRWHVLDEITFDGDGDAAKLADALKARIAQFYQELNLPNGSSSLKFIFRGDPAGEQGSQADSNTPFRVLANNGIPALPASSNSPTLRRGALDRPLTRMVDGGPGIVFSPRCKVLRKGLAGSFCYRRVQVKGDERFQDKPDKNFWSHVCEALEYALMDSGEHAVANAVAADPAMRPGAPPITHRAPPSMGSIWNPFDA